MCGADSSYGYKGRSPEVSVRCITHIETFVAHTQTYSAQSTGLPKFLCEIFTFSCAQYKAGLTSLVRMPSRCKYAEMFTCLCTHAYAYRLNIITWIYTPSIFSCSCQYVVSHMSIWKHAKSLNAHYIHTYTYTYTCSTVLHIKKKVWSIAYPRLADTRRAANVRPHSALPLIGSSHTVPSTGMFHLCVWKDLKKN